MNDIYDLIIIGSGPAGLSAGLYSGRAKLRALIIEKEKPGGQIASTNEVANYPGSIKDATGPSLIERMVEQSDQFGTERVTDEVREVNLKDKIKVVKSDKGEYKSKSVIIATGAKPKLLGCPGEKDFIGRGVSYCSTCDGDFFTGLDVYVVGGGDSAVQEALHLTKFAKKVTIIHRRSELKAAKSLQDRAFKNEKIDYIWDSEVKEIKGEGIVNSLVLENLKTGEKREIIADDEFGTFGVFIFVGYDPQTEVFKDQIELDRGYIKTDEYMKTSLLGVFAAGDCRNTPLRQVITASADGAIASIYAEKYIHDEFES
ncbi:thioredoxin reductase TrxB [Gottschalkia acidurici 9a]|uniref:Thioredoxin reductase n=1 Tax=Gottschalkia acidurici (strain ATCC 7906 / DSM 604 / BCRC 14475 / CIP 104303 / KCTC 5404 / NCIMB 10678 / 9a) TaxID=1128398 RepID=K0B0C9_GOTA9|nr:thioredoxin-disulfide reductase [Gottschalkia acidurici]AFS78101.1 thioredoxin reductase TrxB [Gottschalkia acidurici 9a]